MSSPATTVPSFEELYERIRALPEGVTGEILEPGVLRTMSRPGKPHRRVADACGRSLDRFNQNHAGAGWWIEAEPEIRIRARLVVPDLSGWRTDRVATLPDENPLTVAPDWCCEILSPTTARDDRAVKLPLYARSNVGWVWLVDPALRLVEIFETEGGRPALVETAQDADVKRLPPFHEDIAVGSWWEAAAR